MNLTEREALELAKQDFNVYLKDGLNNTQIGMVLELAEKYMDEADRLRKELEEAQRESEQWRSKYESKRSLLVDTDASRNELDRMYREALEVAYRFQKELKEATEENERLRIEWGETQKALKWYMERKKQADAMLGQEGEGNQ